MKTYDSSKVILTVFGIPIFDGKADGEWLSIDPVSDTNSHAAGADGAVVLSANNDKRFLVTITLMQTSSANTALATLHALDKNASKQVGPFTMADTNGVSLAFGDCAFVRGPTGTFAKEVSQRVWTLLLEGEHFEGGA